MIARLKAFVKYKLNRLFYRPRIYGACLQSRVKLKTAYVLGYRKISGRKNIIIKYASRSRPEFFKQCLNQWIGMLSGQHNVTFVCSFDDDDGTMKTDSMLAFINEKRKEVRIDVYYNPQPQTKISAINANLASYSADMIVLCQDDMEVLHHAYDDLLVKYLFYYFPDGDGILNPRLKSTEDRWRTIVALPVLGWKYYEQFNYIYHPAYSSLYADNELQLVATRMGKIAHANDCLIINHNWDKISDQLRHHTESLYETDYKIFNQRQANSFDL